MTLNVFFSLGKSRFLEGLSNKVPKSSSAWISTSEIKLYHLHDHLTLLDYPGTNANEEYGKLFSAMGQVNNLTILIVQYNGKMDANIVRYVLKSKYVFLKMSKVDLRV